MRIFILTTLALLLIPFGINAQSAGDEDIKVAQLNLPPTGTESQEPAHADTNTENKTGDAVEGEQETPAEEATPAEEEPVEQEEPTPQAPATRQTPPVRDMEEPLDVPEDILPEDVGGGQPAVKDEKVPKKITIDTVVTVAYQFFDSTDSFQVKYHINMGGEISRGRTVATIRGDAEIATDITGYLAKWPGGECILTVSIAKVPYEISYKESSTDAADLQINFKKEINETWESNCTFLGGSKPFKTQGPPEKWIEDALKKASPPISSIDVPLEGNESSSITFSIPAHTVVEEGLGSAEVKGTGIVTIQPVVTEAPTSSFTPPMPQQNNTLRATRTQLQSH